MLKKFNHKTISNFFNSLETIAELPGTIVSKFYCDTYLVCLNKQNENLKEYQELPEKKEYDSIVERMTNERMEKSNKKLNRKDVEQEVKKSLEFSDQYKAYESKSREIEFREFELELPTISEKDIPSNITGVQRLAIHEFITE